MTTHNPVDPDQLVRLVEDWCQIDPDPRHHEILHEELNRHDYATLADRFAGPLRFGTAGLRAAEGPGLNRMNRVVVRRSAAGISDWAQSRLTEDSRPPRVVIGFDARYGSLSFAEDSAAVFQAAGCQTYLFRTWCPTPLLAFAVRELAADVGIMVTASHNPATDNGYKVYLGGRLSDQWGTGAQIIAPIDTEIAERINHWHTADQIPVMQADGVESLDVDEVAQRYRLALADSLQPRSPLTEFTADQAIGARASLRVVYTPMHGVGGVVFPEMMRRFGYGPLRPVAEQIDPDPDFPTVVFPNPEEHGALDLALSTANREPETDLIIAHDPDADRLAVAIPSPSSPNGTWQQLSGNDLGLILGSLFLARSGSHATTTNPPVLARSVVSSPALARLADHYPGAECIPTLTGFKWISRVPDLSFGFEEALGYCVAPEVVRDKDGLSAGLLICELAAALKSQGSSLWEYREQLQALVGSGLSSQLSLRLDDLSVIPQIMAHLRQHPPASLAGIGPTTLIDYADPATASAQGLHPTELVSLSAEADPAHPEVPAAHLSVQVRPSGTEPKLKCYLEVHLPPQRATETPDKTAAASRLADLLARLEADAETFLTQPLNPER
ncbi:phospho-sugar mutase [Auritidibacter ignavus]|uniref:phospho-sugar mutase n=1 Tax=Auritidibacter ignavus TaxID=678932 RepID=UPI00244726DC|nr:phospho-sugar mutase [Auritidibacter ignavus]WGH91812.1 phospho-sugar mutase [Auritidibacter ignavus]